MKESYNAKVIPV